LQPKVFDYVQVFSLAFCREAIAACPMMLQQEGVILPFALRCDARQLNNTFYQLLDYSHDKVPTERDTFYSEECKVEDAFFFVNFYLRKGYCTIF
jgi:hypothetical protein